MPDDARPFQFTRPRGARRKRGAEKRRHIHVSIHAPTRGATTLEVLEELFIEVSIHAPTRGATGLRGISAPPLQELATH